MARIILQNTNIEIDKTKSFSTGFISDRELLKRRSARYMELISGLDAKTLTDTKGMADLINAVKEEFGTADIANLPLGILAKCFLGHPHEVHTLDLSGNMIIKHYKISEPLPEDFEKARILAKHNAYVFVEIYRDKIILIREDGTASKL
ncbi:hypothetical protein [Sphingobacterium sp. BIGb0165]|uniref:hypothetical protein n=1 Tax=Sphingobacterium sp. BIGb0165 TaxID=2940615 RepID=UPI0021698E6A|nr:hypothetical protein [Sphingobacterium sp. BIGb0165]MCS4228900.1 hypothetical protein [Sphingobacterium sp. BIGb0165]